MTSSITKNFWFYDDNAWGNTWDYALRTAATYAVASETCEELGARLPTVTELWGVRYGCESGRCIGTASTDTTYHWSMTVGNQTNNHLVERLSDGATTQSANTSSYAYRCIWPNKRGDVLQGRNCYGPAGDECLVTENGLTMDKWDRPAVTYSAAEFECAYSKGQIPGMPEIYEAIHGGAPNGTGNWLWSNEPTYEGSAYRLRVYKWSGAGTNAWIGSTSFVSYVTHTGTYRFRCVYSPYLK